MAPVPAPERPPPSTICTNRTSASRIPAQMNRLFIQGLPCGSFGLGLGLLSLIYARLLRPALDRSFRVVGNVVGSGEWGITGRFGADRGARAVNWETGRPGACPPAGAATPTRRKFVAQRFSPSDRQQQWLRRSSEQVE